MTKFKVAIIGAGTAGLSARREVAKETEDYVVIDDGILGTTCARVGCMPSKVLIQVASDFHRRHKLAQEGISGGEALGIDRKKVMQHVRSLRDRFVRGVIGDMDSWQNEKLIRKRAKFVDQNTLDLGDEKIQAENIIIATGSKPVYPEAWAPYSKYFVDTDYFFEMEDLPQSMAVFGLGVIGIELGQALHRIGVDVVGIARRPNIAGISDPEVRDYTVKKFQEEMNLDFTGIEELEEVDGKLKVKTGEREYVVDKVLMAMGRRPVLKDLGIENLNIKLDPHGIPVYDPCTYRIPDSRIFIGGDVINEKNILHEASDEGRIAGYNAVREGDHQYLRRVEMGVTFSSPNIAYVGKRYEELKRDHVDFEVGSITYEGQGRAIVMLSEIGLVHLYGDKKTGRFLGAELFAPHADHLAHLLAWAIEKEATVEEILSFPFYHPVLEEGLRTAFRSLANKIGIKTKDLEMRIKS